MALKGKIPVHITPLEAACVANWLISLRDAPRLGGLLGIHDAGPDYDRLIGRMRRVAKPRPTLVPLLKPVVVQLDRADVVWFGRHMGRRGLFGSNAPRPKGWVATFCIQCLCKVSAKRGRPRLTGTALEMRLSWHLDERHKKRLKKRMRSELARGSRYTGLLSGLTSTN